MFNNLHSARSNTISYSNYKRLSIILPVYNVEKYIDKCLESLYQQDIPEEEYEVIAVNDCSPDNSRQIILNYQEKHKNLILIDHDKNKKQGGARNTGFDNARGNYIWYIDPDDYIKQNCFGYLLKILENFKLNILQFFYEKHDQSGNLLNNKEIMYESTVLSGIDYAIGLGGNFWFYTSSVCCRIYNRLFLINGNFRFEENIILEDLEYSWRTLLYADSFKIINKFPYNYRIHPSSTMRDLSLNITGKNIYDTSIRVGISILNLSENINLKNSKIVGILKNGVYWRINSIIKPLIFCTAKERYKFYSLLKAEDLYKIKDGLKPLTNFLLKNKHLVIVILLILSPILRFFKKLYRITKRKY